MLVVGANNGVGSLVRQMARSKGGVITLVGSYMKDVEEEPDEFIEYENNAPVSYSESTTKISNPEPY